MKKNIHPENYGPAVAICGCGNNMDIYSVKKEIKVEVCSKCHPFYTGIEDKNTSRKGKAQAFNEKYGIKE